MPFPSSSGSAIDQIAWRLAAGIAAAAALIAVILTQGKERVQASAIASTSGSRAQPAAEAAPEQSPLPAPLPIGGNTDRGIKFCANHVTSERSFVVFSHGTCVIVDEPSTQPVIDAIHILDECADPTARFITREIEDGHHIVTYRKAVFHCIFAEEISSERPAIEESFREFLTADEMRTMPKDFDPPFHAKLGLIARARLNHDASDPVVTKIIRAKPTEEADPYEPVEPPEQADPLGEHAIVPPFLPGT